MLERVALCAVIAACGPVVDQPEPEHEYTPTPDAAPDADPEHVSIADEVSSRMEQQIDEDIYGSACGPSYTSCDPDDPFSLIICGTACFPDQGYCPEYTPWEITNCLQYCMAWTKDAGRYCDPVTCRPITQKKCVYGVMAKPPSAHGG